MKAKILVVDDEPDFITVIQQRLEMNHYEIISAQDGLEGFLKAQAYKPDLVILDIKMAKMDGYMTLRKLRETEETKDIPIIILTAYEHMMDLFKMEGVDDFIVKPFESQDFLIRVARVLNKKSIRH